MQTLSVENEYLFDLGAFSRYLLAKWKWFFLFGFVFAAVFALVSINLPNQYSSETVLVAADNNSSALDGLSGQLGGLAGLAGLNLNSANDKSLLALQVLQSRKFLVNFVKTHQLEVPLFAVERWSADDDSYSYHEQKFDAVSNKWLQRPDKAMSYYPTELEIHQQMLDLLTIDVDKANHVTRVQLAYLNPVQAQQWLTLLIDDLNEFMRSEEINEREQQIHFLQQQLELQLNADIRNVFYALIQEQLKSVTLAKARSEYVFRVLDPALLPEQKSSPKRALITLLGGLVGGFLTFVLLTLIYLFRR
jgi:uncharacterized protein involved in exopolysaccharide biosynthesis